MLVAMAFDARLFGSSVRQDKGGSVAANCVDGRSPGVRSCRSADWISERRTRRSAPSLAACRCWRRWRPARPRFRARSSMQTDGAVWIGRKAIESYVEGAPGRLMRSLKSVLGTAADRGDHAAGTAADQLSRRHRLLSRRGEAARRTGHRPRIALRGARPPRALRRQRSRRRPQGGADPARNRARDRLRPGHLPVRADRRLAGL